MCLIWSNGRCNLSESHKKQCPFNFEIGTKRSGKLFLIIICNKNDISTCKKTKNKIVVCIPIIPNLTIHIKQTMINKKTQGRVEKSSIQLVYKSTFASIVFFIILVSGQAHSQLSPKRVQRPNGRDVKSVVAKFRTRVAGSTAVHPLPPSYERLVIRIVYKLNLLNLKFNKLNLFFS